MTKKLLALVFCFVFLILVGCDNADTQIYLPSSEADTASQESVPEKIEKPNFTNPLTGVSGYETDISQQRPVAIMVNNLKSAQTVQTGVNKADIIYETEVEGGITRLMAVYQDVASVGRIGTIRSARYDYIDLAMGHGAIYVHHGQDAYHAGPHLKDTIDFTVDTGNCGTRIKNGLSSEHTLYTDGNKLWNCVKDKAKKISQEASNWQNFAGAEETVMLSGGACTSVTIPFSASYKTGFTYDPSTGLYTRLFGGTVRKDYVTGETTEVKNVFVLMTSITNYPGCKDGKGHRKISLAGGDGYYITNGTYTPIKWSKGGASSPFKFTNTDGTELRVSAGNSWVCIASQKTSAPTIQ